MPAIQHAIGAAIRSDACAATAARRRISSISSWLGGFAPACSANVLTHSSGVILSTSVWAQSRRGSVLGSRFPPPAGCRMSWRWGTFQLLGPRETVPSGCAPSFTAPVQREPSCSASDRGRGRRPLTEDHRDHRIRAATPVHPRCSTPAKSALTPGPPGPPENPHERTGHPHA